MITGQILYFHWMPIRVHHVMYMAYWYTFYFGLSLKKRVVDTELNFVFSSQQLCRSV
jgi:hypothetical protein